LSYGAAERSAAAWADEKDCEAAEIAVPPAGVTYTTTESIFSVPGFTLTETLIWPATAAGGTGTGAFRLPATVIDAIWMTAGTTVAAGDTTTVPQLTTFAIVAPVAVPETVAQTETPGEEATPRTVVVLPPCVTVAEAELLVLHATDVVTPASALTAAVSVVV